MRLAPGLASLRTHKAFKAIRHATRVAAAGHDARIIHISVQRNHIHLLVEADNAALLGEGMRRFAISAARCLNAAAERSGNVFPDRYHAEVITVPRQARHALAYVLNNWRRHDVDQGHGLTPWVVDPFSSASEFRDWRELPRGRELATPHDYEPLTVHEPRSWLLRDGWRTYGRPSIREVPGPR